MEYLNIIIPIITAVITGGFALIGTYASNRKSSALMEYRLQQLENKVETHNRIIERTYKLEEQSAIHEERITAANDRIDKLERSKQ